MTTRNVDLEVMRYDPEKDAAPWFQNYSVPCLDEWAILDALIYIKENIDSTLSFRWSCHMMVCGSCAMNIDGTNTLACTKTMDEVKGDVKVYPLPHMSVIKDLVPDMTNVYAQYA